LPAREDAWLARVLERPVFVVEAPWTTPCDAGFCYAKVPVDEIAAARRLAGLGFALVDINITFSHTGAAAIPPSPVRAEPARHEHFDALIDIAGRCFRYSRFHLDPQISDEAANRVKSEWVRSYTEGRRGVELLAAVDRGQPLGFLAVLADGPRRIIDLVGVAPEAQGRRLGSALVSAFVERHRDAEELLVGTQAANVPSLRLYSRHGFTVSRAAFVFHRHAE
jgi:GNAT superfamily N-acetyltransferase